MKEGSKGIGLYFIIFFLVGGLVLFLLLNSSGKNLDNMLTDAQIEENLSRKDIDYVYLKPLRIGSAEMGSATIVFEDSTQKSFYVSDVNAFREKMSEEYPATRFYVEELREESAWSSFLPTLIIVVIAGILMVFLLSAIQNGGANGQMANFGKSRAEMMDKNANKIRFKDVAGLHEEKEEVKEIVEFLKSPQRFIKMGARIPKGVLLVGPPGTGKTYLAKACAGEAGVPFFSISGSDFVEMFVGVGASRVRDMFDQAKRHAPCIVFIDEIDAVGRQRGTGLGGSHDEREQTLNQLLVEMDGFTVNEGVIVLAATNRVDILDPALLRPGRFDRQVVIGRPDVNERLEMLEVHAKNKPLGSDVDLPAIARTTAGFTPADLENLLNEASLIAAKESKSFVTMAEIQRALIKVCVGTEKKSRVVSDQERSMTAYHEAGHAILSHVLPLVDPVHSISIIPTGMAAGYTMHTSEEDKLCLSKAQMEQEIMVLLGGRVAEQLKVGDITTGASNDIGRATEIARNMVTRYGMSESLGPIQFGSDSDEVFIGREMGHVRNYSENVAEQIDREVRDIILAAEKEATRIISEYDAVMEQTHDLLMAKERITGEEFAALFAPASEADAPAPEAPAAPEVEA